MSDDLALDVDDYQSFAVTGFYPTIIHESRYNGSYEGGAFWLTAGIHHPKQHLGIAASDNECARFWEQVHGEGMFGGRVETPVGAVLDHPSTNPLTNEDIIVVTADTPDAALEHAREIADEYHNHDDE